MQVRETFFSVEVGDMERATAFYTQALGASVAFASPQWSSLNVAGVRLGLSLCSNPPKEKVGLHFAVDDLDAGVAAVTGAGGAVVLPPTEVVPNVLVADVTDTEGNVFSLTKA